MKDVSHIFMNSVIFCHCLQLTFQQMCMEICLHSQSKQLRSKRLYPPTQMCFSFLNELTWIKQAELNVLNTHLTKSIGRPFKPLPGLHGKVTSNHRKQENHHCITSCSTSLFFLFSPSQFSQICHASTSNICFSWTPMFSTPFIGNRWQAGSW